MSVEVRREAEGRMVGQKERRKLGVEQMETAKMFEILQFPSHDLLFSCPRILGFFYYYLFIFLQFLRVSHCVYFYQVVVGTQSWNPWKCFQTNLVCVLKTFLMLLSAN